jgi:hypothetical protein
VAKRKVVPCVSNYPYEKFGEIWTSGRSPIQISKCGCLKILINKKMSGPTCQSQAPLKRRLVTGVIAAQPLPPPRAGAVDRPPRPLRASSPLAVGPKEKPVLSSFRNRRRALTAPLCLSPRSSAPSANHRAPLSCASKPRQAGR